MTDDLISRQAAIKTMTEAYEDTDAEWILKKIPSALQWIPINERLPKNGTDVLVTYDHGTKFPFYSIWVCHNTNTDDIVWNDGTITAWMPLPEPWRGEEHE